MRKHRPFRPGAIEALEHRLVMSTARVRLHENERIAYIAERTVRAVRVSLVTRMTSPSAVALANTSSTLAAAPIPAVSPALTSEADLFVASGAVVGGANDDTVGEYTLSGAAVNASFIQGLDEPSGIAASGPDLFVTNIGDSVVGEYTTSGAAVNPSLIPLGYATGADGIAISGSDMFVTGEGDGEDQGMVGEFTTSGTPVKASLITGLDYPRSIAISGSDLFVVSNGTVGQYTTSGVPVNPALITGLSTATGIAISGSDLFVMNSSYDGSIGEYTTSGATINAALITGLVNPEAIATSGQDIFVACLGNATALNGGTVAEYTTSGALVNADLVTGLSDPLAIAVINPSPSPAPTPTTTSPHVVKMESIRSGPALTSINLEYNIPLDASSAVEASYTLITGKEMRNKFVFMKTTRSAGVTYNPPTYTVEISLAKPTKNPIGLFVEGGIVGADGVPVDGDFLGIANVSGNGANARTASNADIPSPAAPSRAIAGRQAVRGREAAKEKTSTDEMIQKWIAERNQTEAQLLVAAAQIFGVAALPEFVASGEVLSVAFWKSLSALEKLEAALEATDYAKNFHEFISDPLASNAGVRDALQKLVEANIDWFTAHPQFYKLALSIIAKGGTAPSPSPTPTPSPTPPPGGTGSHLTYASGPYLLAGARAGGVEDLANRGGGMFVSAGSLTFNDSTFAAK
jgi:hypothetical protein